MLIVVSAYSIATGKMPLVGELAQGRLLRM
jgi:hypothetical protein